MVNKMKSYFTLNFFKYFIIITIIIIIIIVRIDMNKMTFVLVI